MNISHLATLPGGLRRGVLPEVVATTEPVRDSAVLRGHREKVDAHVLELTRGCDAARERLATLAQFPLPDAALANAPPPEPLVLDPDSPPDRIVYPFSIEELAHQQHAAFSTALRTAERVIAAAGDPSPTPTLVHTVQTAVRTARALPPADSGRLGRRDRVTVLLPADAWVQLPDEMELPAGDVTLVGTHLPAGPDEAKAHKPPADEDGTTNPDDDLIPICDLVLSWVGGQDALLDVARNYDNETPFAAHALPPAGVDVGAWDTYQRLRAHPLDPQLAADAAASAS